PLELAGPLFQLGLLPLPRLLQLLERVQLAAKFLLYAGDGGPPCIEGLPGLLQLRLGISQLACSLLQLLAQSLQSSREDVELLPPELEVLAASLQLGLLSREVSLEVGPLSREANNLKGEVLLPLRQGSLSVRHCELPVKYLLKAGSVGLLVRLELRPGFRSAGGFSLRVRFQASVPVGEALALTLQSRPLPPEGRLGGGGCLLHRPLDLEQYLGEGSRILLRKLELQEPSAKDHLQLLLCSRTGAGGRCFHC